MGKDVRTMNKVLLLGLLARAALPAQTVPQATDLPSHPFFIKATWYIGGAGNWDYLTMDPQAGRLYIAHGTAMQAVDVDSGALAGEITGLYEARQVALDDTGQFGFVSDGSRGKVVVFDRQSLKKTAEIDTGPNPRSLVYDPETRLLFVVRANPPVEASAGHDSRRRPVAGSQTAAAEPGTRSFITVIDTNSDTAIGEIVLPSLLGFAVGDRNDQIYVAATDRDQVYRFDAQAVAALLRPQTSAQSTESPATPAATSTSAAAKPAAPWVSLDWSGRQRPQSATEGHLTTFNLAPECAEPTSLAVDSAHTRLFAACNNRRLLVLNAGTGEKVTSLPIGPGVEAVGYDSEHGLLFTANGGAEGSLTIIRQDVTDSYNVIQTLPTRQRAGTLAVDPDSGAVYLVTDYLGVDLNRPGGIGTLVQTPVKGSFQVLKVAN
jgi:DNA-binding beta-propeller fold protein YncE